MLGSLLTSHDVSGWPGRAPLLLPADAPLVVAPGPDPDKVLIVGSSPVAGIGVASHRAGLPGALAHQLSEHSGRGAIVEAIGRVGARFDEIPHLLSRTQASKFDAVVLTAGMIEAVQLVSRRSWLHAVTTVLDALHDQRSRDGIVLVTGMPAPTSTDGPHGWHGRRSDRRAVTLNRTSRAVVTTRAYGHFAQLQPSEHVSDQPTSACYASWAGQICTVLEPLLTRSARTASPSSSEDG